LEHFIIEKLAIICDQIVVPFLSLQASKLAHDKFGIQRVLKDHGLAYNKNFNSDSMHMIEDSDFPLILKPRGGVSSLNVQKVHTREDLRSWLQLFKNSKTLANEVLGSNPDYICEEYLEGILLSAECLVSKNEFQLVTLSQRQRAQHNESVELGSLVPGYLSKQAWANCESFAKAICQAIGFNWGMCHIEMIYGERGFRLLDFNPRLPGVGIPELIEKAYGIDLARAVLNAHVNLPVKLQNLPVKAHLLNRLLASEVDTVFRAPWTSRRFFDDRIEVTIKVDGDVRACTSNLDYFGQLVCQATSPQEAILLVQRVIPILEDEFKLPLIRWSEKDQELWSRFSDFRPLIK
jgi:argininosuccinate lyase